MVKWSFISSPDPKEAKLLHIFLPFIYSDQRVNMEKKNYPSSLIKMWTWRKQIALPHILSRFNLSMNARKFYMKDTWASSPVPCQVWTFGNSDKNMNNRWSVHPKGNGSNSY
jgi:hypothetical protein